MRIAAVLVTGSLLGACKGKSEPPAAGSAASPTPTTPAPPTVPDAAAAAVPAPPPIAAEPPLDPKKPIEVTRKHQIGQRYAIKMTHSGLITEVYDAEATVTDLKEGGFEAALLIKTLDVEGKRRGENAALQVMVRPREGGGMGSVDAEQLAGPDMSMYLTPIEIMLGDAAWPPTGAHKVGDKWNDHSTDWVLVGIEAKDGINYVHYTTKQVFKEGGGWVTDLLLAARDGYAGHADVKQTLKLGGDEQTQHYDITVTPLAPAPP